MTFRFQGIWVPLITSFHEGQIDFPTLQKLARHLKVALAHLGMVHNELREPMQCASELVAAKLIAEVERLQKIAV